jgi:tRNA (cytidine/uridine-2'-O-)-methyltransferase
MFNIVLVHPEIPPNTGNAIRLAANTGCTLHLVEPLGFTMEDRQLKRAGLDYHEYASVRRYASWAAFLGETQAARSAPPAHGADAAAPGARLFAFSTRATRRFDQNAWHAGDWLVFGSETAGLPDAVLAHFEPAQCLRLPMRHGQRSLNLSNAVAVAVFEAWRQVGYRGAD